jgi:hypothetical protein
MKRIKTVQIARHLAGTTCEAGVKRATLSSRQATQVGIRPALQLGWLLRPRPLFAPYGAALLTIVLTLLCPVNALAQQCYNTGVSGGQSIDGAVTRADPSCQVSSGMFVKKGTLMKIDIEATANGQCFTQVNQCSLSHAIAAMTAR